MAKFCTKCGKKAGASKFCTGCGAPMKVGATPRASKGGSSTPRISNPNRRRVTQPQRAQTSYSKALPSTPGGTPQRSSIQDKSGYGLKRPSVAKEDPEPEENKKALEWVNSVLGLRLSTSDFHEKLKSGQTLCNLVNKIKPNTIAKIHRFNQPFMQMENIKGYINGAKQLGLKDNQLFATHDLYEKTNMKKVITSIIQLEKLSHDVSSFKGPYLGGKKDEQKEAPTAAGATGGRGSANAPRLGSVSEKKPVTNNTPAKPEPAAVTAPSRPRHKPKTPSMVINFETAKRELTSADNRARESRIIEDSEREFKKLAADKKKMDEQNKAALEKAKSSEAELARVKRQMQEQNKKMEQMLEESKRQQADAQQLREYREIAEKEKAELEEALKAQHHREVERLEKQYTTKLYEKELQTEKTKSQRDTQLQQKQLATADRLQKLEEQLRTAEAHHAKQLHEISENHMTEIRKIRNQAASKHQAKDKSVQDATEQVLADAQKKEEEIKRNHEQELLKLKEQLQKEVAEAKLQAAIEEERNRQEADKRAMDDLREGVETTKARVREDLKANYEAQLQELKSQWEDDIARSNSQRHNSDKAKESTIRKEYEEKLKAAQGKAADTERVQKELQLELQKAKAEAQRAANAADSERLELNAEREAELKQDFDKEIARQTRVLENRVKSEQALREQQEKELKKQMENERKELEGEIDKLKKAAQSSNTDEEREANLRALMFKENEQKIKTAIEAERKENQKDLDELKKARESQESEYKAKLAKMQDQLKRERDELNKVKDSYEARTRGVSVAATNLSDIRRGQADVQKKYENDIKRLKARNAELLKQRANSVDDTAADDARLATLQEEVEKQRAMARDAQNNRSAIESELSTKISDITSELEAEQKKVAAEKKKFAMAQKKFKGELQAMESQMSEKEKSMRKDIEREFKEQRWAQKAKADSELESLRQSYEKTIGEKDRQIASMRTELQNLKGDLSHAKSQLADAERRARQAASAPAAGGGGVPPPAAGGIPPAAGGAPPPAAGVPGAPPPAAAPGGAPPPAAAPGVPAPGGVPPPGGAGPPPGLAPPPLPAGGFAGPPKAGGGLLDAIAAGKKLNKTKPRQGGGGGGGGGGLTGDLLAEIRAGGKLKKASQRKIAAKPVVPKGEKKGGGGSVGMMGIGQMAAIMAAKRKKRIKDGENKMTTVKESKEKEGGGDKPAFGFGSLKKTKGVSKPKTFENKDEKPAWAQSGSLRKVDPAKKAKKEERAGIPDFRSGLKKSSGPQKKEAPKSNNTKPAWAK